LLESSRKKTSQGGDVLPELESADSLISDDDNYSQSDNDNNDDDEYSDVESLLESEETINSVLNKPESWILPSEQNVYEVVAKRISENATKIKNKKRISALEKATLCYGLSHIIDLSVQKDLFLISDQDFVMSNSKTTLQIPEFKSEEDLFITSVEKVYALFQI